MLVTIHEARKIAAEFGITDDNIISPELDQANRYNGIGGLSSADYFRMYMQETARVIRADEMATQSFQRDAYGK